MAVFTDTPAVFLAVSLSLSSSSCGNSKGYCIKLCCPYPPRFRLSLAHRLMACFRICFLACLSSGASRLVTVMKTSERESVMVCMSAFVRRNQPLQEEQKGRCG